MRALITGASSGLGKSFAKYLDSLGYDLILVSRSKNKLEALSNELKGNVKIVVLDLLNIKKLKELYLLTKNEDIDILINNAGFGLFGEFDSLDLTKEMDMIDLNIKVVHILTKLFLKDMEKKDKGYILNIASAAGFGPGPLMSTYYATKSYVLNLTLGINEELKRKNSKVVISALCPGPVNTNFNNVAGVKFSLKGLESDKVAKYAIKKMFKKKRIIIPGFKVKIATFLRRLVPTNIILKITYKFQKKKDE